MEHTSNLRSNLALYWRMAKLCDMLATLSLAS